MAALSREKEAVRKRVQRAKTLRTDAYRKKDAAWNRTKRAKTLRTAADRTKDAARQRAKRARQIAKQGLKELVNGATYRELQAVEIHDLLREATAVTQALCMALGKGFTMANWVITRRLSRT